jgi:hypothetical protein
MRRHLATIDFDQAICIVFDALGSAVGMVPVGNAGGNDIGMFKRLPMASDIGQVLKDEPSRRV